MKKTRVTLFALLLLGAVGCNEGFEPDAGLRNPATENQINSSTHEIVVHENKTCASQITGYMENYYKLEHMRTAYSNLMGTTRAESDEIIEPTHCHYKFIPKDGAELTLLEDCPDLELFAYPLDAIVSEGEYFESENPLLRYAVVPIDMELPDVERELLYEMFIPDDSRTRMPTRCAHIDADLADRLVDEAMRITGNEEEPINKTRASTWYGRGRLTVYDESLDVYIPLRGVKVRITRAGVTHTAITDSLGNFRMTEGFKYGAEYSIIWERADWDIRDGATGQASYKAGSNVTDQALNLNIVGGKSLRYCHIHRACYRHFYQTKLEYVKAVTYHKLKISYMPDLSDSNIRGKFYDSGAGVVSDIKIYKGSASRESTMPEIFAVTSHEIGHAAHCFHVNTSQYNSVDYSITEGWAEAVAYYTIQEEYEYLTRYSQTLLGTYVNITSNALYYDALEQRHHSNWPGIISGEGLSYSPLFIDLIDNENQIFTSSTLQSIGGPNDVISGYTFPVLNNVLVGAYAIHTLKTNLRANKPAGVTDADIDTLFATYEMYWVNDN